MDSGRELKLRQDASVPAQVLAPNSPLSLEHARQSAWDQGAVGLLCAVGGYLMAYWSMQGLLGLAVIVICVAFSTMVTAALCHYYERSGEETDELNGGARPRALNPGWREPVSSR